MKKQMESLGLSFDFDAFDFEESNNNKSSYLQNKVSLEEVRQIEEAASVEELEQLFLKSYEEECKPDDILFDGWKNSFEVEEEDYPSDQGDYMEPTCEAELIIDDEPILCGLGM